MKKLELKGGVEVPVKSSAPRYSLSNRDILIGLLMASATPILTQLYEILMAWLDYKPVVIDYRALLKSGISAGIVYLGKNFFDKGKIVINTKDYEEAKK